MAPVRLVASGRYVPPVTSRVSSTLSLSFEQEASLAETWESPAEAVRTAVFRVPSFDRAVLAAALQTLLGRHEALRMRLVREGSGWRQRFLPPEEVKLRPRLFTLPAEQDREADVAVAVSMRLVGEDLGVEGEGPLRVVVAAAPEGAGYVGIAVHRVALDALSFRVFAAELEAHLVGNSHRTSPASGEQRSSYVDYVTATVGHTRPQRVARNTAWWIAQAGRVDLDSLRLPGCPAVPDFGPMAQVDIPLPTTDAVEAAARRRKETSAALLLGATVGAFASLAGSGSVLVSTPATPGRALVAPDLLGNLTMPLPLVVDVDGDPTEDVRRAGAALTEGLLRWSYSFAAWRDAMRQRVVELATQPVSIIFVHRRVDRHVGAIADSTARVGVRSAVKLPPNHVELWFAEDPEAFVAFMRYSSTWLSSEVADELRHEVTRRVEQLTTQLGS